MTLISAQSSAFAYDCMIDGICYNLNNENKTATTTYVEEASFSGGGVGNYSSDSYDRYHSGWQYNTYYYFRGNSTSNGVVIIPSSIICNNETYTVTEIGAYSFARSYVKIISLPPTIQSIANCAFYVNSNLEKINFPESLHSIGSSAFYKCTSLTNINIQNSSLTINSNAFYGCSSLFSIDINCKQINERAFSNCTSLFEVNLHGINNISNLLFNECTNLSEFTVPKEIESIGNGAFNGCSNLRKLTFENSKKPIKLGCGSFHYIYSSGSYTATGIFQGIPINDLYIGREIYVDKECCFVSEKNYYYYSLVIPFNNCPIKRLIINDGITDIPDWIFYSENINSISFPSTLKTIGSSNRLSTSAQTQTKLYSTTPPIGEISIAGTIHVPSSAYETYKNDSFWGQYSIVCDIDDDITVTNGLTLSRSALSLQESRQYTLIPTIYPSDATIKTLTWTSSDEEVATVSNGVITAIKPGTATITAKTTDGSNITASCALTVTAQPSATFNFAQVSTLSPTLTPAEDEDDAINIAAKTFTNNNVSMAFGLGSRSSYSARLWTLTGGATELRTYNGATLTFSVPANNHIKKITITGDKVDVFSTSTGTFSDGVWTGDAQTVVLNCSGTSNVKNFKVDYDAPIVYELEENGVAYTNSSELYYDKVNYTRTFNNTNWQALFVPLTIKYDDWKNDFEIATINDVNMYDTDDDGSIDKTEIELIKIKNGSLVPNTPYFIKARTKGEKTLSLTNATLYPAEEKSLECSSTTMKFTFQGTYSGVSGQEMMDNHYYALVGGSLSYATSTAASLKPYRWYMKVEDKGNKLVILPTSNVRIRVLGEDIDDSPEANAIDEVESSDSEAKEYYTTDGRKLDAPIKGLNIVKQANGKIIKIWKK